MGGTGGALFGSWLSEQGQEPHRATERHFHGVCVRANG
jgi:hypothetical protein